MAQVHYVFDFKARAGWRLEIDLSDYTRSLEEIKELGAGEFPLGLSSITQWQSFCIGPHSDIPIGNHQFHIGQRAFNRFIELDLTHKTAQIKNPGVHDQFLSCTNWVGKDHSLWFASWPIEDSFRRIQEPAAPVHVNIWRRDKRDLASDQIWTGFLGDFLHQLSINVEGRYLVLCEMGMRSTRAVPAGYPGNQSCQWQEFKNSGIRRSEVLILDLEAGNEWRLSPATATAAHVEFDIDDPRLIFLSCHNVGLVNGANTLFGPGAIYSYRLEDTGPRLIGGFSMPDFYRVTSHQVFRHRTRTFLAVTGFPDRIYLIDAGTMQLYKMFKIFNGETIDTQHQVHFCKQDPRAPYGLASSQDGEFLYVSGSGIFFIIEIATGKIKYDPWEFYLHPQDESIAGHLTIGLAE
jgi:hypothetical protein